jgi:hypothetical protein
LKQRTTIREQKYSKTATQKATAVFFSGNGDDLVVSGSVSSVFGRKERI